MNNFPYLKGLKKWMGVNTSIYVANIEMKI